MQKLFPIWISHSLTTILLLLLASSLYSCKAKAMAYPTTSTDVERMAVYNERGMLMPHPDCEAYAKLDIPPTGDLVEDLIVLGKRYLGKPYRYRGVAPWPFDCSGYLCYLFGCFDIQLPRTSADMAVYTERIDQPQPGDLLFFKGRNRRSRRVGHVALVIKVEGNSITMMHSTTSRGIIIEKLENSGYFSSRFLWAGRIPALYKRLQLAGEDLHLLRSPEGQGLLTLDEYLAALPCYLSSPTILELVFNQH